MPRTRYGFGDIERRADEALRETGRVCRPRRVMITSTQCRGNIEENDFVTRVSELRNRLGYRDDCLDLAGKDREFIAKGLAGRDAVVR